MDSFLSNAFPFSAEKPANKFPVSGAFGSFLRCQLDGAQLVGVSMARAKLRLSSMQGADIRRANFTDADLSSSVMSGVVAEQTVFSRANLSHCRFDGANLQGAVFQGTQLCSADLSGANLSGAVMSGANLAGANLSGAILDRIDFVGTRFDEATRWPEGFDTRRLTVATQAVLVEPLRRPGLQGIFSPFDLVEQRIREREAAAVNTFRAVAGVTFVGLDDSLSGSLDTLAESIRQTGALSSLEPLLAQLGERRIVGGFWSRGPVMTVGALVALLGDSETARERLTVDGARAVGVGISAGRPIVGEDAIVVYVLVQ